MIKYNIYRKDISKNIWYIYKNTFVDWYISHELYAPNNIVSIHKGKIKVIQGKSDNQLSW